MNSRDFFDMVCRMTLEQRNKSVCADFNICYYGGVLY